MNMNKLEDYKVMLSISSVTRSFYSGWPLRKMSIQRHSGTAPKLSLLKIL